MTNAHASATNPSAASPFFIKWAKHLIPDLPSNAHILDLACGTGRLGRLFLDAGFQVTFADKILQSVMDLEEVKAATLLQADLEARDWPFSPSQFDGAVVGNYLYRPRFQTLLDTIKPGGFLLYETFAVGNEAFGRPKNPDFLLKEDELITCLSDQFTLLESYHGLRLPDKAAVIQNAAALKNR